MSPSVARSGARVNLDCRVRYDDGSLRVLAPGEATVELSPSAGLELDGGTISVARAGVYDVTCRSGGLPATPARLEIRAGEPVRSIATVDRSPIRSGESAEARCRVEDAAGNEVTGVETTVAASPLGGVTIDAGTITVTHAGTYQVTCSAARARLERVPALLEVLPGAPARIEAVPDSHLTRAGAPVGVACWVADAAGNRIMVDAELSVTPPPALLDPLGFTATVAGPHEAVCALPAEGLVSPPAIVLVTPALPARLEIVAVDPVKAAYLRHDVVELDVQMFDVFANETTTPTWEITSIPAGGATFAGLHRVALDADGLLSLIARVTSETEGGAEVSDSVTVLVDAVPPEVIFETPLRAEIIQGPEGAAIAVRGEVVETGSGISGLELNGSPIPVDAQGRFATSLPTSWGINLIHGTVSDLAGNSKDFAQSFEYSDDYRRAGPGRVESGKIDSGIVFRLGQTVLDDNASDVDDLATIARLAIQNADLAALIPSPVTNYHSDCSVLFVTITGDLRLFVDDVTFGTPTIDITAQPGGLHLRVVVPNLSVDMHTSGDVCDIGLGLSGNASVNQAVIEGDLQVSRSGSNIIVTMPSATVSLSGLSIDLDLPSIIDWAVDGIISLFTGAIANVMEDALEDTIRGEVPGLVDGFLSSVSLGTGLDLPPPIAIHVDLASSLGSLSFQTGGGELGFDTTVYAMGTLVPEPRGGIIQYDHSSATFPAQRPLGAAISFDLINQALYSVWYGGGLELDLTEFLPATLPGAGQGANITATASALLPPVILPSGDATWPLALQLGDLEIAAHLDGVPGLPAVDVTVYATAFARARATISPANEIVLEIEPSAELTLEVIGSLEGIASLDSLAGQLERTLESLLPVLFNDAIGVIRIPTLDLSGIAGGYLPPGIVLGLGNVSTQVQPSHLVVEGTVVAVP